MGVKVKGVSKGPSLPPKNKSSKHERESFPGGVYFLATAVIWFAFPTRTICFACLVVNACVANVERPWNVPYAGVAGSVDECLSGAHLVERQAVGVPVHKVFFYWNACLFSYCRPNGAINGSSGCEKCEKRGAKKPTVGRFAMDSARVSASGTPTPGMAQNTITHNSGTPR
jgi:hypothetical protein